MVRKIQEVGIMLSIMGLTGFNSFLHEPRRISRFDGLCMSLVA